jgi:F0F1-type ATP synthase assembly protein I
MENILETIGLVITFLTPITIGVVQMLKDAFGISSRFIPLVSVGTGVALCPLTLFIIGQNPFYGLLGGLIIGLSACGLYSGTKATLGK